MGLLLAAKEETAQSQRLLHQESEQLVLPTYSLFAVFREMHLRNLPRR
jgi:hypothetical protein